MLKIGVFVCWCGSNIAATVDVEAVAEAMKHEPGVVYSTNYQYMCSAAGQKLIKDAIKECKLDGVVVCSCSPRMHEVTFRKAVQEAGLNPYMLEVANIREQCSWIHRDKAEGTAKAIVLAKAAVAKLRNDAPLQSGTSDVTKRCLVIGGGIAGIQTALDVADAGYEVDIVEQRPTIGGRMAQLDKTFPTLDCAACILTPKMVEASQNEKINIISYAKVEKVAGFVGNFTATIRKKARYVDETKCTGCALCTTKCPSRKGKNEFNMKLDNRGAIYIPFAQAIPNVAVIDPEQCIKLKTGKCGLCEKVCTAGAINYKQQDELIERKYGAIVVATGFKPIDPTPLNEFGYADSPDVVTSLEFERLMNAAGPTKGTLLRPSDGTHPKTIVFVQCVGSRCDANTERGKPYCSKICCMYTAKHAMLVREKYPDTDVHVFYIDVRTPGKNFDEFYRRAVEQYGVDYIKGMVGKVAPENGKLMVQGSDLINNCQVKIEADMVVLATAIEPDPHRALDRHYADRVDGYQRLLHRSASQAPSGRVAHRGHIPLGRGAGPQGHTRDRGAGRRGGVQGHRSAGQGSPGHQPVHRAERRAAVQRLLAVREGVPVRRYNLHRQGSSRPGRARSAPRGAGQPGGLPGLRRVHRHLPVRRYGPEGLLQQTDHGGG